MSSINKDAFLELWPQFIVSFMAFIEVVAVIILFLTELGNIGANFWTTNVFAGGWAGLIMLIHLISLFIAGWCSPGPKSAFHAVIFSILGLVATAALISFNAAFVVQPSTCILTSSCVTNAASTSIFSYNFQQSFLSVFNSWGPFKSYTASQAKFLFQTMQLGIGSLCFILCIIYLIIYFICTKKAKQQVAPSAEQPVQQSAYASPSQQAFYGPPLPRPAYYGQPQPQPAYYGQPQPQPAYYGQPPPQQAYYGQPAPQQAYYAPPPPPPPPQPAYYSQPPPQPAYYALPPPPPQQAYYAPPPPQQSSSAAQPPPQQVFSAAQPPPKQPSAAPSWRPPPRAVQAQPGEIPWSGNK